MGLVATTVSPEVAQEPVKVTFLCYKTLKYLLPSLVLTHNVGTNGWRLCRHQIVKVKPDIKTSVGGFGFLNIKGSFEKVSGFIRKLVQLQVLTVSDKYL